ncbi:MAG: tocopherol cyclase family protein [Oscillospiraceae bacterium]|jgi:hypothetical protein
MTETRFYGSPYAPYFEGWYLKHQNGRDTLALIPAVHTDRQGRRSASLQVITNEGSYTAQFPIWQCSVQEHPTVFRLGNNLFSEHGCRLSCQTRELSLRGVLRYGPMARPDSDIMGPFRFVPFLECRHSVFSFCHRVDGHVTVNGKSYCFRNGAGYMEGDRGRSFPSRYLWTQANIGADSVLLSVADIPYCGVRFNGCIASVYLDGKEHRFATYYGARILSLHDGTVVLQQGSSVLAVRLLEASPHPLHAPRSGSMTRTIHESPSCKVQYRLVQNGKTLLNAVSEQASFENSWYS